MNRTSNHSIEGNRGTKKRVDDVWVVVKLLVDHKGKDTHLSGTTIVQFDGLSSVLGNVRVGVGAVVLELLLDGSKSKLDGTNGEEGEGKTRGWASVEDGKSSLDLVRTKWNTDTGGGNNVSKNGKHGDSSVLGLDSSKSVESLLVSLGKKTKRVPEAKRRLGTKLRLEGHLQGRGSGDLGDRSEGGSANKGSNSKDGSEHYLFIIVIFVLKYKLMTVR